MTPHNHCYEFGPYQLDLTKRVLSCDGETISLTPKATEILIKLVSKAGQVVEKDQLLKEVWPNTFVEEANLSQNIFTLRKALRDDRNEPKYIETIAKRGYRFVGTVKGNTTGSTSRPVIVDSINVIAVLPFINRTATEDLEHLAEGLTDNVINSLSRLPKLRVMSKSALSRYKTKDLDPREIGRQLGVNAVLVGNVNAQPPGISITAELVDVSTGWQLWGDVFDSPTTGLHEVKEEVTLQVLNALKQKLIPEEDKKNTARYTENTEAYQAYLEGRHHWSKFTRAGIETAILHFKRAIEIDPKYALGYAAIIDCYLRLTTNYLPPDDLSEPPGMTFYETVGKEKQWDDPVKLRFKWDWAAAERELHRAIDLRTEFPAAHQWFFAYWSCKQIYEQQNDPQFRANELELRHATPAQIASLELTPAEQLQVLCAIVREQVDVGNYEAGRRLLQPWWTFGDRPNLQGLSPHAAADLLFTTGVLANFLASTVHLARGQIHAEELLNGSVALYDQLSLDRGVTEGRIALAFCYHRQGLFDMARKTLNGVLDDFSEENRNRDLRAFTLMRLGCLEGSAGRLKDALPLLIQATEVAESCGPWITPRCYLELAGTYRKLALSEGEQHYVHHARELHFKALYECAAIGHHRYSALTENNIGLLMLEQESYEQSEIYLIRACRSFDVLCDSLRGAQSNESLARLYIQTKQYSRANEIIDKVISILEVADEETVLAEALTTKAIVSCRLGRLHNAQRSLEAAYRISERCRDNEGASLALVLMLEELGGRLEYRETAHLAGKLKELIQNTQQQGLRLRAEICISKYV